MKKFFVAAAFLLFTQQALSAPVCADYFLRAPRPKSLLELMTRTPKQAEEFELLKAEYERQPWNKLNLVMERLKAVGVEAEFATERTMLGFGLNTRTYVRILPVKGAYLNLLALRMKDNYGVELTFDPAALRGGTTASYWGAKKRIHISLFNALTGRASDVLFHEIKHAALSKKENDGKASLVNGHITKLAGTSWPWGKKSESGYQNFMVLEELLTWTQDAEFYIRASMQKLSTVAPAISRSGFEEAPSILRDVQDVITFHKEVNERDGLKFKFRKEDRSLTFGLIRLNYFDRQSIPERFWRARIPASEFADPARYFASSEGQAAAKNIAREFLQTIETRLERSIQRLSAFATAEREEQRLINAAKIAHYETKILKSKTPNNERAQTERKKFLDAGIYAPEFQAELTEISRRVYSRYGFLQQKLAPAGEPPVS